MSKFFAEGNISDEDNDANSDENENQNRNGPSYQYVPSSLIAGFHG